jgi:hypothetical protein
VTPSVTGDFVVVHILVNDDFWSRNDTSTDDVKGGLETGSNTIRLAGLAGDRVEIGEELVGIEAWSIIIGMSPLPLILARIDIDFLACAATASPPAVAAFASSGQSGRVTSVPTVYNWVDGDIGDIMSLELLEPLLDLGRVGRRDRSEVGPLGGEDCVCDTKPNECQQQFIG